MHIIAKQRAGCGVGNKELSRYDLGDPGIDKRSGEAKSAFALPGRSGGGFAGGEYQEFGVEFLFIQFKAVYGIVVTLTESDLIVIPVDPAAAGV